MFPGSGTGTLQLFQRRRQLRLDSDDVALTLRSRSVANHAIDAVTENPGDDQLAELADRIFAQASDPARRRALLRWPLGLLPNGSRLLTEIRQVTSNSRDFDAMFRRALSAGGSHGVGSHPFDRLSGSDATSIPGLGGGAVAG